MPRGSELRVMDLEVGSKDGETELVKTQSKARPAARKYTKKDDQDTLTPDKLRIIIKEEIKEAMSSITNTLSDLRSEFSKLQNSVDFISKKYDTVLKRIDDVEHKCKSISVLEPSISEVKCQIDNIQSDIQKQEQWSRRSNIEIVGLPQKTGENLLKIISQLGTYVDCPVDPQTDIDFVTRVAHKSKDVKKPKPVVVRFLARHKKDNFLARLREIKDFKASDIGYPDTSRIFFNEHLTMSNKILLNKVKKMATEKVYKYVWVKNQAIMVRKNDSCKAIHISSETDLKKIV